jgi:hypothetical protein
MSVFVEIKNNHKKNKSSFSRKICIKIFFGRGLVDTERVDTKPVEIRNSFDRLFLLCVHDPQSGWSESNVSIYSFNIVCTERLF